MTKKVIIELSNVEKEYQLGSVPLKVLKGVSLKVHKGEFLMIVGPSGSGKSTMMNMVGALDLPSAGTIKLDNKDISKLSESDLAQIRGKKIGFVFQQFNLLPQLSAMGNVMLPMMFQRESKEKRLKRAEKMLTLVGLGHRLDHKPTELSGGERQRVAIARSLANDPEFILADEPTGNLDTKTGGEVMDIFHELNKKEGKTIVMVTHDLELVPNADRVIHIRDGLIEKETKNHKGE